MEQGILLLAGIGVAIIIIGFLMKGKSRLEDWSPIPFYVGGGLLFPLIAYLLPAVAAIVAVASVIYFIIKTFINKKKKDNSAI